MGSNMSAPFIFLSPNLGDFVDLVGIGDFGGDVGGEPVGDFCLSKVVIPKRGLLGGEGLALSTESLRLVNLKNTVTVIFGQRLRRSVNLGKGCIVRGDTKTTLLG